MCWSLIFPSNPAYIFFYLNPGEITFKNVYRIYITTYFEAMNCRFHNTDIKKKNVLIPPHPTLFINSTISI